MWTLKGKPTTQRVTKALAKEFADMDPAPHDRPLSERRLQVYARLLQQGSFRPVTWAKADCKETGGVYRVNGKHTSVLLSGLAQLPEFFVTVESYDCETLEDVAKLYATFDSKMMSRTSRDINMAFAATVPELADVSVRVVNVAVAGMSYHLHHGDPWNSQPAERAETLLEYPEFVLWLQSVYADDRAGEGRSRSKHLFRQPVVAAMFGTWQKAKGPATEFWTAVRDETGAIPGLPDRKLARYLLTVGVSLGSGANRLRTASTREFYVKSLHAWNAWRKNETTNLNYYADKNVPAIK